MDKVNFPPNWRSDAEKNETTGRTRLIHLTTSQWGCQSSSSFHRPDPYPRLLQCNKYIPRSGDTFRRFCNSRRETRRKSVESQLKFFARCQHSLYLKFLPLLLFCRVVLASSFCSHVISNIPSIYRIYPSLVTAHGEECGPNTDLTY